MASANDILRCVSNMIFDDGELAQNVFYVRVGSDGDPSDDADVLSDMGDWMDDIFGEFTSYLQTAITPGEVFVYVLDTVNGDFDEVGSESMTYGTGGTEQLLPRAAALQIDARTSNPDRTARKYFGGFTELAYATSGWSAAALVAAALAGDNWVQPFVGALTGTTFTPGIWSLTDELFYPFIAQIVLKAFASYQRRRKEGVGV